MAQGGVFGAVLYAKEPARLAAFYAAVTGIELEMIENGFTVLGAKPSQLVIVRIPKRIAENIDIATPTEVREDTPVKIVFGVDDIARARKCATELGGAVKAAEHEWAFEGARVCDGYDPEGNVFQLRQIG